MEIHALMAKKLPFENGLFYCRNDEKSGIENHHRSQELSQKMSPSGSPAHKNYSIDCEFLLKY